MIRTMGDSVTNKKIALVNAGLFFFFWLAVFYAGADHPLPLGFIWIIALDLLAALVVYFRVPYYLAWVNTRRKNRIWHVLLDGLVAGLVCALFALLFPGGGEPSVERSGCDYLIWFLVVGAMGVINAVCIYFINAFVGRRFGDIEERG